MCLNHFSWKEKFTTPGTLMFLNATQGREIQNFRNLGGFQAQFKEETCITRVFKHIRNAHRGRHIVVL